MRPFVRAAASKSRGSSAIERRRDRALEARVAVRANRLNAFQMKKDCGASPEQKRRKSS